MVIMLVLASKSTAWGMLGKHSPTGCTVGLETPTRDDLCPVLCSPLLTAEPAIKSGDTVPTRR